MQKIYRDFENIAFKLDFSYPEVKDTDSPAIEEAWEKKLKETPFIFNGSQYAVNKLSEEENKLQISFNKLEYKTYVWARESGLQGPGLFPSVVGVYLYDDKNFYFPRRGRNVTYNSGKLNGVIGSLDYKGEDIREIWDHIKAVTLKEVEEEVVVDRVVIKDDLRPFLIGFGTECYRLDIRFIAKAKILDFKNKESSEIVIIPRKELSEFVKAQPDDITPSELSFFRELAKGRF